jgi:hypothetical protein
MVTLPVISPSHFLTLHLGLSTALEWLNCYLTSSACPLKIEVNVNNLVDLNSVARNQLFTHVKPWICIQELDHLNSLVVSTFIRQLRALGKKSYDPSQLDIEVQLYYRTLSTVL